MNERARGPDARYLRVLALALLSLFLFRCSSRPAASPVAPSSRAVVISLDGLGGVRLNELLAEGKLRAGGFATFAEKGLLAGRAIDVTPSLTPSAHVSAITGAPPSRTGIVGHYFHEPGAPFGRAANGFSAAIQTETLWEAAMRQGLRVGVLLYPGADGENPRRRGSFGLVWPERPLEESSFVTLQRDAWSDAATAATNGQRTFSPARQARIDAKGPGGTTVALRLVALDTTDDGVEDYDLVRVERSGATGGVLGSVRRNGWFLLELPGPGGCIATWCRLVELDPGLRRAVVYVGAFYGTGGYPGDYGRRLETSVGCWPGPPDGAFFRSGHRPEDEDAYEEQATRLAEYLTKVMVFTIGNERWDLLIGYQPIVDEIEHAFEPPAGDQSEEAVVLRRRVERAFATTDRSVASLLSALSPRDSVFVLSDHGIVPLTQAVNIERFLEEKGWTIVREKDAASAGARRVQVCTSSGIAHLYVDPALPAAAREEAVTALLKDTRALPEAVIDEILQRKDLARVDLDNSRSGDVVILLKPGVEFSWSLPGVLGPAHQKGGHGYRNAWPVLDASFLALGPGVRPARPPTVSLLDVAPSAARALGIEPPGPRRASLE